MITFPAFDNFEKPPLSAENKINPEDFAGFFIAPFSPPNAPPFQFNKASETPETPTAAVQFGDFRQKTANDYEIDSAISSAVAAIRTSGDETFYSSEPTAKFASAETFDATKDELTTIFESKTEVESKIKAESNAIADPVSDSSRLIYENADSGGNLQKISIGGENRLPSKNTKITNSPVKQPERKENSNYSASGEFVQSEKSADSALVSNIIPAPTAAASNESAPPKIQRTLEVSGAKLPETEVLKAAPTQKTNETDFTFNFDKFLTSVSKQAKASEAAAPPSAANQPVFEQVEPQLLQIISLMKGENEKKTMKMRLHPAELGTIEINLEKNDAGKITAHFQTETETARQSLAQNIEQLRASLQNSGWQVEHLEIICQPFSPADSGEQTAKHSRQPETIEHSTAANPALAGNSEESIDSKQIQPNRLLSVHA